MKKIKFAIYLILICILSVNIAEKSFANEYYQAMQQAFQQIKNESMSYYRSIENCTPSTHQDGMFVIEGQNGGYCNIKQYMIVGSQKHPYQNCKMPMNEAKAYAQEKIRELENGAFNYDSSNDKLNNYCKSVHQTIHFQNSTYSY